MLKLENIKTDLDQLGERIDSGLETDRTVVWLFAIVRSLILYLEQEVSREASNHPHR